MQIDATSLDVEGAFSATFLAPAAATSFFIMELDTFHVGGALTVKQGTGMEISTSIAATTLLSIGGNASITHGDSNGDTNIYLASDALVVDGNLTVSRGNGAGGIWLQGGLAIGGNLTVTSVKGGGDISIGGTAGDVWVEGVSPSASRNAEMWKLLAQVWK